MTYQVNPDGSVTIIKSTKDAQANAEAWKDYSKDLGQSDER